MGLMEKAFRYKNEINKKGEKTLIDKIAGPAETSIIDDGTLEPKPADLLKDYTEDNALSPDINPETEINPLPDEAIIQLSYEEDGDSSLHEDLQSDHSSQAEVVDEEEKIDNENISSGGQDPGIKIYDIQPEEGHDSEISEYLTPESAFYITRTQSEEELFDELIFQIIGQLAVTSASIIWKSEEEENKWEIVYSRGITLSEEDRVYKGVSRILGILEERKDIIDIEEFNSNPDFADEYIRFLGIDVRILVPIIIKDSVKGAVLTGDKITSDGYDENEKILLKNLADISSGIISHFRARKTMEDDIDVFTRKQGFIKELNRVISELSEQSPDATDDVTALMKKMGVDDYCIFMPGNNMVYSSRLSSLPGICDLSISDEDDIIRYLKINRSNEGKILLSEVVSSTLAGELGFPSTLISAYTCYRQGVLLGFALICEKSPSREVDDILVLTCEHLIMYLVTKPGDNGNALYADTYTDVISYLQKETERVKALDIPLSMIHFSFKNLRRFYGESGKGVGDVFNQAQEIITSRLSGRDRAFRFDYNRILLVLPGRDKKYSATLGNILRNDLAQKLTRNNIQLLSSFVISTYPDDGISIYELIDQLY